MRDILVIDDDGAIRDLISTFLQNEGFRVTQAEDGLSGLNILKQQNFELVLIDLFMPGLGGLDVIKEMKELHISAPSIVITANGTVKTAVEAMRLGVHDYITKPFNLTDLRMTIGRVLDLVRLQEENTTLKRQLKERYNFQKIIGNSLPMQRVYRIIEKVADTDSTILISGETGTGKELVAKTIHFNSSRSGALFVPINCVAIPKDLIESELFGHEKGAFTGAINTRIGRFEMANRGTLFLDEISEVQPALQAKLLRVIQEKEFERVGGTRTLKMDVRIIAATNRDLEKAVREGTFREDLYYRLNVIPLKIPPLRDRREDIPLLVEFFMTDICKKKKKSAKKISHEAREFLESYWWPGNVRELSNAIERMIIFSDKGEIGVDDLPSYIRAYMPEGQDVGAGVRDDLNDIAMKWSPSGIDLNGLLEEMEKKLIKQALEKSGGVKNKAAALLGLNRTTLLERMKKKGIMGSPAPERSREEKTQ